MVEIYLVKAQCTHRRALYYDHYNIVYYATYPMKIWNIIINIKTYTNTNTNTNRKINNNMQKNNN